MKKTLLTVLAIAMLSSCGWTDENIALMRPVTASSNYDFNLCSQLVTDGLLCEDLPAYLTLEADGRALSAAEQVPLLDMDTYSRMDFPGGRHELTLGFHNYKADFGVARFVARLSKNADWNLALQVSEDGSNWQEIEKKSGNESIVNESFTVSDLYHYYRYVFSSPQDCGWSVRSLDFHDASADLNPTGNKHEFYSSRNLSDITPASIFRSVWMSRDGGSQWLSIDLGRRSRVSGVEVLWASSPATFGLSASDDGQNWERKTDGKRFSARYVRLDLEGNPEGEPYMISEVRVMGGRKSASVVGAAGPDGWQLRRADVESPWLPAIVPGTVLRSYIDMGVVPDPNFADNQLQISESYFRSDFIYRKVLDSDPSECVLSFDGISWKAEVFLNSEAVGKIDGAFKRASFDLGGKLLGGGRDTITVLVRKPEHPGFATLQNLQSPGLNGGKMGADNPSFHASVGWDWIPTIRGRNIGIWNDVRMEKRRDLKLSDPCVKTVLDADGSALVTVLAKVGNHGSETADAALECILEDMHQEVRVSLAPGEEKEVELPAFRVDRCQLWWPKGYGEPTLHELKLQLLAEGGASCDELAFKAGFRQMEYNVENGALQIYVNGRRFVGKGGNWGFSESNLRYTAAEYDAAVRYHADMNFTMIRNWVGQTGDDEFYEACDRHGIMVWQDFWLANPSDGPDPYDEDMFMDNAQDLVSRIRRHPCIALYCGRNEGYPPASLNSGLASLVSEMHGDIIYIPDSADDTVSGRGPYTVLQSPEYFELPFQDKFHSERGMPSIMNIENLERTLGKDHLWPIDDVWGIHDFTLNGAQKCSNVISMVEKAFGPCENAEEFTRRAQWINYNGYRALFESRSRGRNGLLLWMSHPAWPSMVWQTYDYYFEPLASYFACKKACEPLHIQFNPSSRKIEVVNTSAGNRPGLTARLEMYDMYGRCFYEDSTVLDSDEDSTLELMDVPADIPCEVYYIKSSLNEEGEPVSENFYILGREEGNLRALSELPKPELKMETGFIRTENGQKMTALISNVSESPALMIRMSLHDRAGLIAPVIFNDNYFSLLPGETREITAEFGETEGKIDITLML
ncbi:MAG: discoidin domain-containing protein [Bacteroidales bacterium]|nr:discoidin domain-containing protein [Candidatus Cryptobacteroides equifaecalis]